MAQIDLHDIAEALVADGKGILAADESDGTIKKRFDSIDLESTEDNRRAYRDLLFTTPGAEEYISGVILYDETIRQNALDGTPFPKLLESKGVIPGIKVDLGAKPLALAEGETVTEGLDGLRERLAEYYELGARFAKWRATYSITGRRCRASTASGRTPTRLRVTRRSARRRASCRSSSRRSSRTARTRSSRAITPRAACSARSSRSSSTSASTSRERCSSRTWCSPATARRIVRRRRRGRGVDAEVFLQARACCGAGHRLPLRAASRTRTRPRTSTR